jgi:hypothetical protein
MPSVALRILPPVSLNIFALKGPSSMARLCVDDVGRPIFRDLFRRRQCVFIAFDLLYLNGEDLKALLLIEGKATFGEPIEPEKKRPARIRESVFIPWLVRSHSHLRTYLSKERYVA